MIVNTTALDMGLHVLFPDFLLCLLPISPVKTFPMYAHLDFFPCITMFIYSLVGSCLPFCLNPSPFLPSFLCFPKPLVSSEFICREGHMTYTTQKFISSEAWIVSYLLIILHVTFWGCYCPRLLISTSESCSFIDSVCV